MLTVWGHGLMASGMLSFTGRWQTPDENDVQFAPGKSTFFNMAVWNGEDGDRNGLKSVSIRWRPISVESAR